jgi:hypothetical protein
LQTIIRTAEPSRPETGGMLPVVLRAQMNALGLLQISCLSADTQQSWPLEFNMREHVQGVAGAPGAGRRREPTAPIEPNASADTLVRGIDRQPSRGLTVASCIRLGVWTGPRHVPLGPLSTNISPRDGGKGPCSLTAGSTIVDTSGQRPRLCVTHMRSEA